MPRRPHEGRPPGRQRSGRPRRLGAVPRSLSFFLAVPLLLLITVSVGTAVFSERLARENALADAEQTSLRFTRYVIAPVLEEALNGVPGRWEDLDRRVQNRLADGSISTLLIWRPPSDIVYSSAPENVGPAMTRTPELRAAAGGHLAADVDEMPEAGDPVVPGGRLVEVYVPLRIGNIRMAVATFFGYDSIERGAALLRGQIIPVSLGALVILQLVQVPIGISLFRRVRRQDAERAGLLARSLTASERERRAIAADVHDGPVQELAGVAYALGALRPAVSPEAQHATDNLTSAVRDVVAWLRRLMADLYPPDMGPAALPAALEELAASVRSPTVTVEVEAESVPELTASGVAVLYRTAKEALADVAGRATVSTVWVSYGPALLRGAPAARLQIEDDGAAEAGDDTDATAEHREALQAMRLQIAELGGSLVLGERTGRGSIVSAVVPAVAPAPPAAAPDAVATPATPAAAVDRGAVAAES